MYDSLHLHILYSAADNIPRAQFPKPCALLAVFFFFAVFAELFLAGPYRRINSSYIFFFALQCFEHARSVWDC